MRVVADSSKLTAIPGSVVVLDLSVTNTSELIDGISARVVGLDPDQVVSQPALLSLFPEADGHLVLSIDVPLTFPAGRHPLTVELLSSIPGARPHHVDIDLVVAARPQLVCSLRPPVSRARRRSRHLVECHNAGNVELTVGLSALDPERLLRTSFSTPALRVEPGTTGSAMLTVHGRRRLFGSDLDRPVSVTALDDGQHVQEAVTAIFRQRPLVPRGVLTIAVLAIIIGLWAGAFLLGLTKVFSSDPLTKSAPASFFVTAHSAQLAASGSSLGALAKSGALPAGVGGGIAGTVTAASTGTGTGRIVVEALRVGRHGLVPVSSAATQSDGSYLLLGLLPGKYYLRFSAPGFTTSWFPSAASQSSAKLVEAFAQSVTRKADTNVRGLPASITGTVDAGDASPRPVTQVTARSLTGSATSPSLKVTTKADGSYVLTGLPAPGTYELGFVTDHYVPSTVIEHVSGGQQRSEPTVRLSAGAGVISGTVVAKDPKTGALTGLGGVTVTTSQDGQPLSTVTPTQGAVGSFALGGLATPGTYVISYSAPGFGARSDSLTLTGGQSLALGKVVLTSGTGTVTGTVTSAQAPPGANQLGGVSVSVGGSATPLTTTTVSGLGTYDLSGLVAPGSYTLTFSLNGYGSQTVPLRLAVGAPQQRVDVVLSRAVGSITGRVYDRGDNGVGGATITVTDGQNVVTTTSTAIGNPAKDGTYEVAGLAPGNYTVTVDHGSDREQTLLVTVSLPGPTCVNLRSVPSDSSPEDPPPCA
ncbi:MAG: hypothetical protein JWO12_2924 [Frankiales bacterium]|nr:hypothetical protein [Frankiales bacterium]